MSAAPPLRVAVLLDGLEQPRWVDRALDEIARSDALRITLLLVDASASAPAPPPRRSLLALYERVDRGHFRVPSDPFERVDVERHFGSVPRRDAAATPRSLHDSADVIVSLAPRVDATAWRHAAPLGLWHLRHGEDGEEVSSTAGLREVLRNDVVTYALVEATGPWGEASRTLGRIASPTDRYSLHKSRARLHWKSAPLLRWTLERAAREGIEKVSTAQASSAGARERLPRRLGVALPARVLWRYVRRKLLDLFTYRQWFVAYHVAGESNGGVPHRDLRDFTVLAPPPDRFWADPFVIADGDRHHVFLEELPYATNRGHLSVLTIEPDGRVGAPTPILVTDYHLSYPFVFAWEGAWYLLPETSEAGRLELYRARTFPTDWELDRVLMEDVRLVDATLAQVDERWWMFAATSAGDTEEWDQLVLFHAPTPLGPWSPHAGNPVKVDLVGARPAGRTWMAEGRLVRPTQDGSHRYGYGLRINRVDRLTPTEFAETEIARHGPDWRRGLLGTHTLNADGRVSVTDGLWRRSRLAQRLARRRPPGG